MLCNPHARIQLFLNYVGWEWIGHEHLDPGVDTACPLCPRTTWTHANGVIELPDGDILASFMKNNTLVIIA